MELSSYFSDFLRKVTPTNSERQEYQKRHSELREKLEGDEGLKDLMVSTFLQGSYRRGTLIRPNGEDHADVDVVVVTRMNKEDTTPDQALQAFVPFLEKHYSGKYQRQGRSLGITLQKVDLDLVPTSAPLESQINILKSEAVLAAETPDDVADWRLVPSWIPLAQRVRNADLVFKAAQEQEWKLEPLYIPDREIQLWEPTHPLEQIRWTHEKNRRTNGNYLHVVKAIKWWHRNNDSLPKYPKGYPLEHLVGACCPDGISSVAQGVTMALETIIAEFSWYASIGQAPVLPDHGVPDHNVFARVSGRDFARFYKQVEQAAKLARKALDTSSVDESAELWRDLFGGEFPKPPGGDGSSRPDSPKGGFTPRRQASVIGGGRFA